MCSDERARAAGFGPGGVPHRADGPDRERGDRGDVLLPAQRPVSAIVRAPNGEA
jgi:hypothetical protein